MLKPCITIWLSSSLRQTAMRRHKPTIQACVFALWSVLSPGTCSLEAIQCQAGSLRGCCATVSQAHKSFREILSDNPNIFTKNKVLAGSCKGMGFCACPVQCHRGSASWRQAPVYQLAHAEFICMFSIQSGLGWVPRKPRLSHGEHWWFVWELRSGYRENSYIYLFNLRQMWTDN